MRWVFLYQLGEDGGDGFQFQAVVERLKRALADTLAHYLPLAGTLEYEVETGDAFVDCTAPTPGAPSSRPRAAWMGIV